MVTCEVPVYHVENKKPKKEEKKMKLSVRAESWSREFYQVDKKNIQKNH